MSNDFNSIMEELNGLLKQGEADSVVNQEKGEVGSSTQKMTALGEKGDVPLEMPHKDWVDNEKESEYSEDKSPEKKAAFRARKILDSIDTFLEGNISKEAQATNENSVQESLDSINFYKEASFEAGKKAAQEWMDYLQKASEANSKHHKGDLAETAPGEMLDDTDPHSPSDSKSPEASPASGKSVKAPALTKAKDHVEDSLESRAEVLIMKAKLYDDLVKAAEAQDESAIAIAKANIIDFVSN